MYRIEKFNREVVNIEARLQVNQNLGAKRPGNYLSVIRVPEFYARSTEMECLLTDQVFIGTVLDILNADKYGIEGVYPDLKIGIFKEDTAKRQIMVASYNDTCTHAFEVWLTRGLYDEAIRIVKGDEKKVRAALYVYLRGIYDVITNRIKFLNQTI